MPQKDTSQIKSKIIQTLNERGPSLPIHISKKIEMSMLFASAFLSELLSENRIKVSKMKIGGSPLYYTPETETQLENFSEYLKGKEREAFDLLKENKVLKDSNQEPSIRVALRSLKDFARPTEKNDGLYWKYFKHKEETDSKNESETKQNTQKSNEENKESEETKNSKKEENQIRVDENENNPSKNKENQKKQSTQKSKTKKKSSSSKKNEKFFNKVKEYLNKKNIEILDIIGFDNKELILKINEEDKEKILIAHNKKRIDEKDLTKANKKASEYKLEYVIFCLGEPLKKLNNLIDAINNLDKIEKIE